MDTAADRKLFLGGRLKRLRRDLALTQTAILASANNALNDTERPEA